MLWFATQTPMSPEDKCKVGPLEGGSRGNRPPALVPYCSLPSTDKYILISRRQRNLPALLRFYDGPIRPFRRQHHTARVLAAEWLRFWSRAEWPVCSQARCDQVNGALYLSLAHMFCNEVEVLTNWLVSRGLSGYNTTQALKVCVCRGRHGGRQFCQAMSDRFLRNPIDRRLRDTTAGSVRLAICFLRPYIHKRVSEDFAGSTAQVCELAYVIACWPGQWWAREHPEIRDLVKCIVHVVGEEMRESKKIQTSTDASRMHEIVGGLEQLAQAYERRAHERKIHPLLTPMRSPSSSVPASPTARSETLSDSSTSTLSPMMSRSIQTEIYLSSPHKSAHKSEFSISEISSSSPSSSALPTPPATPPRSTPNASIILATPATSTTPEAKPENSPPIHEEDPTSPVTEETPDLAKLSERSVINEVLARTASCFMTGFFIGSFITLCIFSSHRRELAHHLT